MNYPDFLAAVAEAQQTNGIVRLTESVELPPGRISIVIPDGVTVDLTALPSGSNAFIQNEE